MRTKRYSRVVACALVATLGAWVLTAAESDSGGSIAGVELLANGDFEGPVNGEGEIPAGWYRAMIPARTIDFDAGLEVAPDRGRVAFISQAGTITTLCNNWAQRLETIPPGATVRAAADVKTQGVSANAGFLMVQCWDEGGRLIGGGSTQNVEPIGGTQDWKPVSFEFVVPKDTRIMILRCGLTDAGKIWFDNVSLQVVSALESSTRGGDGFEGNGFAVTAESLEQLKRVSAFSDDLVAYAREQLGGKVGIRKEVFAQSSDRYQVVLSLDLSETREGD